MFLLGLAIAAVIAAFVASDASKRGMNAVGWFFGVFLLLIVFLPAYLIVRKPLLPQYQPQLPLPPQPPSNVLTALPAPSLCPYCGKYYAGKASFCPFCGEPQEVAATKSTHEANT
jgi:MFS family permease